MKVLLAALFSIIFVSTAQACYKCGNYKNCYYAYQAPFQNNYQVNNYYPSPLIGQGTTPYSGTSFQNLILPFLDPQKYFSQEQQLQQSLDQVTTLRHQRYSALVEQLLERQNITVEALVKAKAASDVLHSASNLLDTAGVNKPNVSVSESVAKTSEGLLGKYCGSCHGLQNANPSAGLYLGDDKTVAQHMEEKFRNIRKRIKDKSMPPADQIQPTEEERVLILDEIDALIEKNQ